MSILAPNGQIMSVAGYKKNHSNSSSFYFHCALKIDDSEHVLCNEEKSHNNGQNDYKMFVCKKSQRKKINKQLILQI